MAEAFQNKIYGSLPPAAATGIQIRDATEADLPAIIDIHNAAIASRISTAQLEPVTVESQREWFRAHSPAQYPIWVAEAEGAIAGWLSFREFLPRCAYAEPSSSAFTSANNFGVVAWAEDCCRKRSGALHNWRYIRSLD